MKMFITNRIAYNRINHQFFIRANLMTPTTSAALNSVDYFVIFIFGLSMLAGYIRGFMKEVVSLITWVAASVLSTLFAGKLADMFSGSSSAAVQSVVSSVTGSSGSNVDAPISMLAIGASFAVIFFVTLFVGYIVGTLVTGIAQGAGESLTNRFLGAIFGGARGFVLVVVLMFIAELTPMAAQPAWVQSQFVKSFQPLVNWVDKMVHPGLDTIRAKAESAAQSIGGQLPDMGSVSNVLNGSGQ
jgi:membrane protein required for colicin V production